MLFGKQKDQYEKRTVELAEQCRDIAEQKKYRDYFIEEQMQEWQENKIH